MEQTEPVVCPFVKPDATASCDKPLVPCANMQTGCPLLVAYGAVSCVINFFCDSVRVKDICLRIRFRIESARFIAAALFTLSVFMLPLRCWAVSPPSAGSTNSLDQSSLLLLLSLKDLEDMLLLILRLWLSCLLRIFMKLLCACCFVGKSSCRYSEGGPLREEVISGMGRVGYIDRKDMSQVGTPMGSC